MLPSLTTWYRCIDPYYPTDSIAGRRVLSQRRRITSSKYLMADSSIAVVLTISDDACAHRRVNNASSQLGKYLLVQLAARQCSAATAWLAAVCLVLSLLLTTMLAQVGIK